MSVKQSPILVMGKVLPLPSLRWQVELSARALAAAALYHQSRCPVLTFEAPISDDILSGSRLVEAKLKSAGVAVDDIVKRGQSTSTTEELMLANHWMERRKLSRLRIVTSSYHVPRVIRKVKRLNLDGFDVLSPESIARTMPSGPFSDVVISGRNTTECRRKEVRLERLWLYTDLLASTVFPKAVHEKFEVTAGRCLRQLTGIITLSRQRNWKSD